MLDAADAPLLGAGEGARLMAEQLALDHAFGQRAAVDRHQFVLASAAQTMQCAGDHFLAGAGLAFHQHVHVGVGDMPQRLLDPQHGRGIADERLRVGARGEGRFLQAAVFQHQPALLGGMADGGDQALGGIGLGQEVIGALAHALDGGGDVAMAGDQDDGDFGVEVAQPLEQLQPVHVRHADVGHHHAVERARQHGQRGAGAGMGLHLEAMQLQRLAVGAAQLGVVVDEDHAHGGFGGQGGGAGWRRGRGGSAHDAGRGTPCAASG